VCTYTTVTRVTRTHEGPARLHVDGNGPDSTPLSWDVDIVVVVVGVRSDTDLLVTAGAQTGPRGTVVVGSRWRPGWTTMQQAPRRGGPPS
jgi:hypothetical protein